MLKQNSIASTLMSAISLLKKPKPELSSFERDVKTIRERAASRSAQYVVDEDLQELGSTYFENPPQQCSYQVTCLDGTRDITDSTGFSVTNSDSTFYTYPTVYGPCSPSRKNAPAGVDAVEQIAGVCRNHKAVKSVVGMVKDEQDESYLDPQFYTYRLDVSSLTTVPIPKELDRRKKRYIDYSILNLTTLADLWVLFMIDTIPKSNLCYLSYDVPSNTMAPCSTMYCQDKPERQQTFLKFGFEGTETDKERLDVYKQRLETCLQNKKQVVIPISKNDDHSNVILINPITKTIHYFEPHGFDYDLARTGFELFSKMIETNKAFSVLRDYKKQTIDMENVRCLYGVQYNIKDVDNGYCEFISQLFVYLVLHNPDLNYQQVHDDLERLNPPTILHLIVELASKFADWVALQYDGYYAENQTKDPSFPKDGPRWIRKYLQKDSGLVLSDNPKAIQEFQHFESFVLAQVRKFQDKVNRESSNALQRFISYFFN